MPRIVPIAMLFLSLHSMGFWCDDCQLVPVETTCRHSHTDHPDHHPSEEHSTDPCCNSLCSFCGHALSVTSLGSTPQPPADRLSPDNPSLYRYVPSRDVFRPPRA